MSQEKLLQTDFNQLVDRFCAAWGDYVDGRTTEDEYSFINNAIKDGALGEGFTEAAIDSAISNARNKHESLESI